MEDSTASNVSVFQTKYNEFVEDLLGAFPEYTSQIQAAKALDEKTRLDRFQSEVKVGNTLGSGTTSDFNKNPKKVLPGFEISNKVWNILSDNTKKAIWEHLRILSICCFMENGFGNDTDKPEWMEDALNEMKKKLEGVDFENIIGKFMNFFKSGGAGTGSESGVPPGLESIFSNGFPTLPERFLKGQMAKLAQELVKEVKPEDFGFTQEVLDECQKSPGKAFGLIYSVFTNNSGMIEKMTTRIGKRLSEKVMSGQIRPNEIAREAEELAKEFADNKELAEMMAGIKSAFGFEDMETAKKVGKEGTARLAATRERMKKKLEQKQKEKEAREAKEAKAKKPGK